MNENIIQAIERIASIYKVLLLQCGKDAGLSPTQILIIEYISKNMPELNTLTNIAKEFNLKKSTISDSINSLIKKGYLQKEINLEDNRISNLKLTEKSILILNRYKEKLNEIFSILESLKYEEKNTILKFLSELITNLYEKKIIQKARLCLNCSNFKRVKGDNSKPFYCEFTKLKFDYNDIKFNCHYYNDLKI